jgi:hypothetical protein
MKHQLFEKDNLGMVKAYTYVVEFQKRGLPHAHFLLIMTGKYKYTCPDQYIESSPPSSLTSKNTQSYTNW